ncbi:hypothetical protein [Amycolatopsis magusensis]|uniref:hypothetical protein n=1 Tax=Amycolatopsis magusensis TaxID=882444 RepID=UPI0037AC6A14
MAGGYTFDADAVADRIRELEDLGERIREQNQVLSNAASAIFPPSPDEPARRQAQAAAESIVRAVAHNEAMHAYAEAYLGRLAKAAGRYTAQEGETAGALFEE